MDELRGNSVKLSSCWQTITAISTLDFPFSANIADCTKVNANNTKIVCVINHNQNESKVCKEHVPCFAIPKDFSKLPALNAESN